MILGSDKSRGRVKQDIGMERGEEVSSLFMMEGPGEGTLRPEQYKGVQHVRSWRTAGKETAGTRFLEQQGSWHDCGRARRPAFWRGQKGEGVKEREGPSTGTL